MPRQGLPVELAEVIYQNTTDVLVREKLIKAGLVRKRDNLPFKPAQYGQGYQEDYSFVFGFTRDDFDFYYVQLPSGLYIARILDGFGNCQDYCLFTRDNHGKCEFMWSIFPDDGCGIWRKTDNIKKRWKLHL